METIAVAGRALFVLMFVMGGLNHLLKAGQLAGYAKFKGVPMPQASVALSGVALIGGGLSVALGVWADAGALVLAVVLAVMAVKMHDFWNAADAESRQMEMVSFLKNISMSGAALVIFAAVAGSHAGARVIGPMLGDGWLQG